MTTDHLFFSNVIPTRKRAGIAANAVGTALVQPRQDYKILVGDNECSDLAPAVAREVSGDRVRHLGMLAFLSMPDSWEFAQAGSVLRPQEYVS
jgi:hypothetical protein